MSDNLLVPYLPYDLNSMMRWAFYYDYGTTPEQAFRDFFGLEDKSTWHFQMSLETMLFEFDDNIRDSGTKNNIDARAIAGAIAWEYEENLLGRYSDYSPIFNDGAGWGSMHTDVARELRPRASDEELWRLRMSAASAVALVGEYMGKLASLYFELTHKVDPPFFPVGIWVNERPEIVSAFYQAGEPLLRRSADKQAENPQRASGEVTLDVSQIEMGAWIKANIERFAGFQTSPTRPTSPYLTANSDSD